MSNNLCPNIDVQQHSRPNTAHSSNHTKFLGSLEVSAPNVNNVHNSSHILLYPLVLLPWKSHQPHRILCSLLSRPLSQLPLIRSMLKPLAFLVHLRDTRGTSLS